MRTTLDLDPRLMQRIRRKALDEGKSLKEVINQTLAHALDEERKDQGSGQPYRLPVFSMGSPAFNLDKALEQADRMESDAIAAKLEMRK